MRSPLQLFSDAWKVFTGNLRVFMLLSLISSVIVVGIMLLLGIEPAELENDGFNDGFPDIGKIGFILLSGFITMLTGIAIIKVIVEPMTKVSSLYRFALAQFPAYLWVSILMGLSILAGFILLIIPGIFLLVSLSFATLIVILEGVHSVAALKRSHSYIKGHWFQVFGRYAFLILIGIGVMFVANAFFGSYQQSEYAYAYSFFFGMLGTLTTCFTTAYIYELYLDLKKQYSVPEAVVPEA